MKSIIVAVLALGIGFGVASAIVSNQKNAEIAKLKSAAPVVVTNDAAPAPVEKTVAAAPSAPAEESPQDILNDLLNLKIGSGPARNPSLRQVVFKLETLALRGTPAVPAVRAFIGRNLDVSYTPQREENQEEGQAGQNAGNQDNNANGNNRQGNNRGFNRGQNGGGAGGGFGAFGGGGFNGGGRNGGARRARTLESLRSDWVVPPSLRLGLIGTLKEIGGVESEQALVEMLASTGRGVEVAYLTLMLEELAPGKYRDSATAAAKELLTNPPVVDNPDRYDQQAKTYLYSVLEYYQDASFVPTAQQLLVGADGRIDQDAMDYLNAVLKDQSVSILYAAMQNASLTNQFDKMNLGREILNYVGQNTQANQFFTDTLNNADLDSRLKAFMVIQQAGAGFGQFANEAPTDPQVVQSRISLLQAQLTQHSDDDTLTRALNAAINSLQTGDQIDMREVMGGGNNNGNGQGGGRRNRGNRGGGGGGGND